MTRQELISALDAYRRPGSPNYAYHFRRLPAEVIERRNVRALLAILGDGKLSPRAREHAAGALGEIGDARAVPALIEALAEPKLRRGAATALGRMKAAEAAGALRRIAPKVKAAQWALSQMDLAESADEVVEDLRTCQLRAIRTKVEALDADTAGEVGDKVQRELEQVVRDGCHLSPHRWMVTALQYLAPPEAGEVLIEGLRQYVHRGDPCIHAPDRYPLCSCVPNRLMRALGDVRPPEAISLLVDLIERIDSPIHQHQAAACIEKIVKDQNGEGTELLLDEADRLRAALDALEEEAELTPHAEPESPWDGSVGSPNWRKRVGRATAAISRLLKRCESVV